MAENEGLRKTGEAIVYSILPDVCLTPPAMLPVPYQIMGKFSDSVRYAPTVRMTKQNTVNMDSRLNTVYGDELGVGGGIFSGVNKGWCRPITFASKVRAQGHNITFHTSYYWMNCAGPEGTPNTIGRVTYVDDVSTVYIGPLGAILGKTNPPLQPETHEEKKWYDKALESAMNAGSYISNQYDEYEKALWKGRVEAVKEWGSMISGVGQFAGDMSGAGIVNWAAEQAGYKVPGGEYAPNAGRGLNNAWEFTKGTASGLGSLIQYSTDAQFGLVFDHAAKVTGTELPSWLPSADRARKTTEAIIAPTINKLKDGHIGEVLGGLRASTEKLAVEIVVTEGAGELLAAGRATEGLNALKREEELAQALKKQEELAQALKKEEELAQALKKGEEVGADGVKISKADYWAEDPLKRGRLVQDDLAKTEYGDWLQTDDIAGYEKARNYPVVDFAKGNEAVSLKTMDTELSSWPKNMRGEIREFSRFEVPSDLVPGTPTKIMDIRVQPGGIEKGGQALQDLVKYGEDRGIKVIIKEYP